MIPSLDGTVAFTGRLASMRRADAFEMVRKKGGKPRRGVTKTTDTLIVGQLGWPLLDDGRPSNSLKRAKTYDVPIASEPEFLEAAGLAEHKVETKCYSKDQIVSLAKLPATVIEQLIVFGLLTPEEGQFSFHDLAAARQLADLFSKGVKLSTITHSLHEIHKWLPGIVLTVLRLIPADADALILMQFEGQTDTRGQFLLPLEQPSPDADFLFEQAETAEEAGDLATAERLYRQAAHADPKDATALFNLANVLRLQDRSNEAESSLGAAIQIDPDFAEAWYNLADLLDDVGRTGEAIRSLSHALQVDSDYADAIFNLGLLHQKQQHYQEAAECWRRYLDLDQNSPWVERARRGLKYCEIRQSEAI